MIPGRSPLGTQNAVLVLWDSPGSLKCYSFGILWGFLKVCLPFSWNVGEAEEQVFLVLGLVRYLMLGEEWAGNGKWSLLLAESHEEEKETEWEGGTGGLLKPSLTHVAIWQRNSKERQIIFCIWAALWWLNVLCGMKGFISKTSWLLLLSIKEVGGDHSRVHSEKKLCNYTKHRGLQLIMFR